MFNTNGICCIAVCSFVEIPGAETKPKFSSGPFYYHGLILIPECISNYIHYELWDEITYHS